MVRKSLLGTAVAAAVLAASAAPGAQSEGRAGAGAPAGHPPSVAVWELAKLREATARFHRVSVALEEGYEPFGGCFSDAAGGMGFHYANAELMEDPEVDPLHPELLLYERQANGDLRLVGVEYLTFQAAWHEAGHRKLPRLFGQTFHLNSTLLPEPFYLLHVWPWKHNPSGLFADWNPRVSCPQS